MGELSEPRNVKLAGPRFVFRWNLAPELSIMVEHRAGKIFATTPRLQNGKRTGRQVFVLTHLFDLFYSKLMIAG